MRRERLQNKGAKQVRIHPSKDLKSSAAAKSRQSANVSRSGPRETVGRKLSLPAAAHEPTRTRTAAGKRKNCRSEVKHRRPSKRTLSDDGVLNQPCEVLLQDPLECFQPAEPIEGSILQRSVVLTVRHERLAFTEKRSGLTGGGLLRRPPNPSRL